MFENRWLADSSSSEEDRRQDEILWRKLAKDCEGLVDLLASQGLDVDASSSAEEDGGRTALHVAASGGNVPWMVKKLLVGALLLPKSNSSCRIGLFYVVPIEVLRPTIPKEVYVVPTALIPLL